MPKRAEKGLYDLIDQQRQAAEAAAEALKRCIDQVNAMLTAAAEDGAKYDDRMASHLGYLADKHAQSLAKLRSFGEKVKTQSLELTPEQREMAIAAYIRRLPVTRREHFRKLLDDLDDSKIQLVS